MATWDIEGKTFLITGGASGLGALYAEAFLKEGAKKVAVLDINEQQGANLIGRLNNVYPNKAIFVKCDLGVEDSITQAFEKVLKDFKQIDVIINNAGIMNDSPNVWRKSCEVNIQGLVSLTFKGLKHMRKDEGGKGGTIINVASIAALIRYPFLPNYCGSKMAVLHFSQSLAMEPFFEETGVRVLTICFGATSTPLLDDLGSKSYDRKTGENLVEINDISQYQRPESAVAACLKMFKEGTNRSVWLSKFNETGKDITSIIDEVFNKLEAVVMN